MVEHMECDQFSLDILTIQEWLEERRDTVVTISLEAVEQMVEYCQGQYGNRLPKARVEHILDLHEPYMNDAQRDGYKRVLKKIYGRRIGFRISESKRRGRDAPLAPVE